jgi:probable HAF family extracellular repeat protein
MKPILEQPTSRAAEQEGAKFEIVDMGPFDNNRNHIIAVNDAGQCVGVSVNPESGRVEAFLQSEGRRVMLGTLTGSFSIARGINNRGEIVGGSLTQGDENFHGFLYRDNQMLDLNDLLAGEPGWELIQAFGINNRGDIVGIGCYEGQDRIVLLRPKAFVGEVVSPGDEPASPSALASSAKHG